MRSPLHRASLDRNIWLLLANTLTLNVSVGVFALVFNLYLASLGYREDFIGVFSFVNTAAIGLFALASAALSNRVGPRWCLAASSVLVGVSGVAVSLTTSEAPILVWGAALGVGSSLAYVPQGPFIMDNCSGDDSLRGFAANFAVASLAAVLGSLASGYMPAAFASVSGLAGPDTAAYRLTLVVGGLVSFVGVVPMLLARPAEGRARRGRVAISTAAPLGERAARRALLLVSASVGLIAIATGLVVPFFNVYFAERLGASVEQIGVIFAVGALLVVPVSLLGPAVARRFGTVGAIALGRILTAPFLVAAALYPALGVGALAYVGRTTLLSLTWPIDNAFAMGLMPPRMRATQAAIRSGSWNLAWGLASLVSGQLIVMAGYPVVFLASAAITVVATVCHYASFRGKDAREAGSGAEVSGASASGTGGRRYRPPATEA